MLALTWTQSLLALLFCTVCVLLILLILIQRGRGGGLSGAFGGVGSYSPFGTKTGDALTWATVVLTAFYLLIAVFANRAYRMQDPVVTGAAIQQPQPDAQPVAPGSDAVPAANAQPAGETPAAPAAGAPAAPVATPAEQPNETTPPASPATQP